MPTTVPAPHISTSFSRDSNSGREKGHVHVLERQGARGRVGQRGEEVGAKAQADALCTIRRGPDLGNPNDGRGIDELVGDDEQEQEGAIATFVAMTLSIGRT